jgi:hypothetical protein
MAFETPDSMGTEVSVTGLLEPAPSAKINSHLISVSASFLHPVGSRFNPANVYRNFYESLSRFLQCRGAVKQALNLVIYDLSISQLTKPF